MSERTALDDYETDVHRWWHLSRPSEELLGALADGWMDPSARVLDVGCGLATELGHLAAFGAFAVGIDLSTTALARARGLHPSVHLAQANGIRLPFASGAFDAALDRGCFHYIPVEERPRYGAELARVLRPGGRLLLRACTTSEGKRNDVDEEGIRRAFRDWRFVTTNHADIDSDSRSMPALIARIERF